MTVEAAVAPPPLTIREVAPEGTTTVPPSVDVIVIDEGEEAGSQSSVSVTGNDPEKVIRIVSPTCGGVGVMVMTGSVMLASVPDSKRERANSVFMSPAIDSPAPGA